MLSFLHSRLYWFDARPSCCVLPEALHACVLEPLAPPSNAKDAGGSFRFNKHAKTKVAKLIINGPLSGKDR